MTAHWYVIHVYSGFEKKVAQSIKEQAALKGMADHFPEVLVPTEEVVEMRRGSKVSSERKFFPGYVLCKMDLTDEAWHLVKNTPKVTGFLGGKSKPTPITQAEAKGMSDQILDVLVPTEEVVEMRRGSKVNSERKFFPGYVLVKMEMTDEAYHLIKNTPKVTGFLGSGSKPMPVSEKEVARIIGAIEDGVERPKPTITFEIGEQVRVTDGPFASFNGSVERVDEERERLFVTVSIFGRATPVELEYTQVEKTS